MDETEILAGEWDEAVVIALGANLPAAGAASVEEGLERALARFSDAGLRLVKRSRWWRSAAWPDPRDPAFVNGVAIVETATPPAAVLAALHRLEDAAGRVRAGPNAPRPLDLDLVAYGRRVQGERPALPHPRAHERRFVMGPLAEIAPGWRHPVFGLSARDLAEAATVARDAAPSS